MFLRVVCMARGALADYVTNKLMAQGTPLRSEGSSSWGGTSWSRIPPPRHTTSALSPPAAATRSVTQSAEL